jgi:hypothetical protein
MQARRCITSAVAFALSSALPAIASPLAATTSATTRTHAASVAQSAARNTVSIQARPQAAGRTPIEQNTIRQNTIRSNTIEQHTVRQSMIRQHEMRQFGREQASINSNGRFAVNRDFGRDRAADRHELNDARRMHRAERWARDRDDIATNRHDSDRFSGHWHNYARSDRDHDRFMRRASYDHSPGGWHRYARNERDHESWAQSNVNSNGRYALNRDFGRDRAADRQELNDARRTGRSVPTLASTSAEALSTTQSSRWQTADHDYASERAVERTNAGARAAQIGERTAGRFGWDHQLASRTRDRTTSLAEATRQPERVTPHFVNVMGMDSAGASSDRDDITAEK